MHIFKRIFLFLSFIFLIACDTSSDNSVSDNDSNKDTEQNQNTPSPSNPTDEDNVTFVNKTDLNVKVFSDSLKTVLLAEIQPGENFSCNADINTAGNVFYYTYYFRLENILDYIAIDTVLIPYGVGQNIVNLSPETMTTVNIVTPAKLGTNKNIVVLENLSPSAVALGHANSELQPENKPSTLLNENEHGIYLLDSNVNLADYKIFDAGENIDLSETNTTGKGYIYHFTYTGKEAILNIKTLLQSSEEKKIIELNTNYLDVIKKLSAEEYKVIVTGTMTSNILANLNEAIFISKSTKINLDLSGTTGLTSIGYEAFWNRDNLTSVILPDSVTEIGESAFEYCDNLTSVTIPDSVTSISYMAFYGCYSLTNITIPDSVTEIGESVFSDCYSLTSVTIGNGVTRISKEAFDSCSSLANVTIGNGVTFIGYAAFSSCDSLTNITIPDSVTEIGDYAFSYCNNLTNITIPDSVTRIGECAFYSCDNLTSVTFENTSTWYCYNYNGDIQVNVTNPTTNATNLKSTYCEYWWYKK